MNKIFKAVASLSVMAVAGLIFSSCNSNPDSAGFEYMPDMYRSPAIEPYVDYGEVRGRINEAFTGVISAKVPPMNTIPYYGTNEEEVMMMLPYWRKPSPAFASTHGLLSWDFSKNTEPDFEYNQAANDKNPLALTLDNAEGVFKKGKEIYAANCMHCHGEKGDGNGPMVASGAYSGVPDYKNLTIADGQMFYSIYYGKGMMGSHASMVNKKEIWTLVHYIKKFQDASYGSFDANVSVTSPDTTAKK
jgi:mono/diheme cytochrome c family protein